jgi:hypothetical protein
MKKIIISLIFSILSNLAFAHKADKSAAVSGKEKRIAEMEKQFEINKLMLENRDFVLQADYLQDRWGDRVYVNSMINYLAVDSKTAVIQTGSDYRLGRNGVGGITAKGRISNWKLSENKKQKTFNLSFTVTTNIGVYDLQFMIGPSDYSTARLTGIRAGQLTFAGDLVPYSESSVFEGQSS